MVVGTQNFLLCLNGCEYLVFLFNLLGDSWVNISLVISRQSLLSFLLLFLVVSLSCNLMISCDLSHSAFWETNSCDFPTLGFPDCPERRARISMLSPQRLVNSLMSSWAPWLLPVRQVFPCCLWGWFRTSEWGEFPARAVLSQWLDSAEHIVWLLPTQIWQSSSICKKRFFLF